MAPNDRYLAFTQAKISILASYLPVRGHLCPAQHFGWHFLRMVDNRNGEGDVWTTMDNSAQEEKNPRM